MDVEIFNVLHLESLRQRFVERCSGLCVDWHITRELCEKLMEGS